MPNTTDLHGYQLFSDGEENWEHRTDFQQLDIDVEVRGDTDPETAGVTPKNGAMYRDTSTGEIYLGDGDAWNLQWDLGAIGSGDGSIGDSISVQNNTGEVFAREFSGADLAAKVENAASYLTTNFDGRGRIRVTPKSDGTAWTWGSDVTIEVTNHYSLDIDIDQSVKINYPGDGTALTLENASPSHDDTEISARIIGGQWEATGDPTAWLVLKDPVGVIVQPRTVSFTSGTGTSVGVSIENHARWAEMNYIRPGVINADICVDFVPASVTGGSGTSSFQGCRVERGIYSAQEIGIRTRGNLNYCQFENCQIFLHSTGAIGIELDGNEYRGCTFDTIKTEEHASDCVSLHTGPNYDGFYGPTFFGGHMMNPTTMLTDGGANNPKVYQVKTEAGALEFRTHTPDGTYAASFSHDLLADEMGLNTDSLTVSSINDGGPITDGDGTERQMWVIPAGASDPADATAEDIIFEESS